MVKNKIFQICPQCNGSGLMKVTLTTPEENDPEPNITETVCNNCGGEKNIEWGYVKIPD